MRFSSLNQVVRIARWCKKRIIHFVLQRFAHALPEAVATLQHDAHAGVVRVTRRPKQLVLGASSLDCGVDVA